MSATPTPPEAPGTHDFTVITSDTLYEGAILALRKDQVRMPDGSVAAREVVEHSGAVAIVALNDTGEILLEYQYRHPLGQRLWELPAGILDISGESPLAAAQRELREETAYAAKEWHVIADTITSPGFSDESVRIFLARGLYPVDRPTPEGEEADMSLTWVPLAEALQRVFAGDIINGIAVAGILGAAHILAAADTPALRPADTPWMSQAWRFPQRRERRAQ